MEVYFFDERTVDCTSDPHPTRFPDLREMYSKIWKVVTDDILWGITSIDLTIVDGDTEINYLSDYLSDLDTGDRKEITGPDARENKVDGLYLREDFEQRKEVEESNEVRHLPNGLKGVRRVLDIIEGKLDDGTVPQGSLSIGVAWDLARQHSCSDYITVEDLDVPKTDFDNQDWYIDKEGYEDHLDKLSELLGVKLEAGTYGTC